MSHLRNESGPAKALAAVVVVAFVLALGVVVSRADGPVNAPAAAVPTPVDVKVNVMSVGEKGSSQRPDKDKNSKTSKPEDAKPRGKHQFEEFLDNPTASQLTYIRLSDGMRMGTSSERFARPALSLIKLYIAEYVIKHGSSKEKYKALDMIATSSDEKAAELYKEYPQSVDDVAQRYGLISTRGDKHWGKSVTSTYDTASFIAKLINKDPMHPVLIAMSQSASIAEDGYRQNFGTAKLPGTIGSKWGWSNSRQLHSSVSFGEDFVVAAAVNGSAEDLADFVKNQVTQRNLKGAEKRYRRE